MSVTVNSGVKALQKQTEYETFSIKIPKKLVSYLEFVKKIDEYKTIEEEIEAQVLCNIQNEIEGRTGEDLIRALGVGELFWEVLGNETYKPNT